MGRFIDLTGKKFNRLTVIERVGVGKDGGVIWRCICECGNEKNVAAKELKNGKVKSCGCLHREKGAIAGRRHAVNLIGQRFYRLEVTERTGPDKYGNIVWLCKCDCGNEIYATTSQLKSGNTRSCGCLRSNLIRIVGRKNKTHGLTKSRIFRIWRNMKQRCYNIKSSSYQRYGGRGITICEEWLNDFKNFYDWSMANGYSDNLSIDRINNNGNYCPENCRWTTSKIQSNNTSTARRIEYKGEIRTLTEWSEKLGINKVTLFNRLKHHTPEEAFTMPIQPTHPNV